MKYKKTLSSSLIVSSKSDFIGAAASTLCMLHCLMTPFIFAVQVSTLSCSEIGPVWWKSIDYIFLVITFFAIYYTTKSTSLKWMPIALYICWFVLAFLIINESLQFLGLPHVLVYVPAVGLTFLHLYNRRYCRCEQDQCCTSKKSAR